MVDLKAAPFNLTDDDCAWVEAAIASMSAEERVGQLFFQLAASPDEASLRTLVERYHVGGVRYNPAPGAQVLAMNRTLQERSPVPLFIACNTEAGGDGACSDGAYVGTGVKVAATDDERYAFELGRLSSNQAAAVGCTMAFAPVADIAFNWRNTEVQQRAFGSDPERVARMSRAYLRGAHEVSGFACAAKHFPGNGCDFRDAHLSNCVNDLSMREWDQTFGRVYRGLIDEGLEAVMVGHIMLPAYVRQVNPAARDDDMMPATLCPQIVEGLLRDRLGFRGLVVTDATHMVGMENRMPRRRALPRSINAGCDMLLFFNDPDEDFGIVLNAYLTGEIPEGRVVEALQRILGMKAHLGLHRRPRDQRVPSAQALPAVLADPACARVRTEIADAAPTLVKYKDEGVLPLTPQRYPRVTVTRLGGNPGPMDVLLGKLGASRPDPAHVLAQKLQARGFQASVYRSPIDVMKAQVAAGERPDLGLFFGGDNSVAGFKAKTDLVIVVCDVASGRPNLEMSKGCGAVPWYVHELPVVVVGLGEPTMLADIPQARTYINAYDACDETLEALVEKLMAGPQAFCGTDPIDSFCGMFDTRL